MDGLQACRGIIKDYILLHVREGSVDALSVYYPQNPPPCTTLIGVEGEKLWQSGGFFTAEVLASIIENADQDVSLNIRMPDFTHLQGKFSLVINLREVKNYVDRKQEINMGSYDLALPYPYPIKVFGNEYLNKRLLELEIVDKQTVIVVPHKKKQLYHRTRDKNTQ